VGRGEGETDFPLPEGFCDWKVAGGRREFFVGGVVVDGDVVNIRLNIPFGKFMNNSISSCGFNEDGVEVVGGGVFPWEGVGCLKRGKTRESFCVEGNIVASVFKHTLIAVKLG